MVVILAAAARGVELVMVAILAAVAKGFAVVFLPVLASLVAVTTLVAKMLLSIVHCCFLKCTVIFLCVALVG
jgi:hypothetical protein